jgi:hypothetical protein
MRVMRAAVFILRAAPRPDDSTPSAMSTRGCVHPTKDAMPGACRAGVFFERVQRHAARARSAAQATR